MPFDRNLDPTSEYTSLGFALFSNLLLRPLMNYRHVAGDAGGEVLPDLAAEMPEVSDDGLTYEFTLREGVEFGPPVDREITSHDVAYAFERIATPSSGARYAFYFTSAIEGMSEFAEGSTDRIAGIETPSDDTIVFHLSRPTGDFLNRLAMPAAAPLPREIAECFDEPGEYGRYLVASGPYMIRGSEHIGTECSGLQPAAGFVPNRRLILVRNPNHNPATDDPIIRESLFRRYEMTVEEDSDKIYRRIRAGRVDLTSGGPNLETIRRFTSRPSLRDNLHVESGERLWYISMNLTQPPFDDVHVRRAANLVMDKDFLLRTWGGDLQGEVATHVLPDAMVAGALDDFDPYPSRHHAGDPRSARREMKLSRYDRNGDGLCDAAACRQVLHVTRTDAPWPFMAGIIESSLAKIGIELDTRQSDDAYSAIQRLPNQIAITSAPGWVKDYPDPFSFIGFLFDSRNITKPTNTNYAMVGFTPERARALGIPPPRRPVPSIDDDIDACVAIIDYNERLECWADVDRKLMTEVVPWARAEAGAIATQAFANLAYGPEGLDKLGTGASASDVVAELTATDDKREHRQVGIVDGRGRAATFTGDACFDWAGGRTGGGYACQGNILTGADVVDDMCAAFEEASGELAVRLLAALRAGDEAGGDKRGRQSAALLVVREGGGYGGGTDISVSLRVDDHEAPVSELERLFDIHRLLFPRPEDLDFVEIDNRLAAKIRDLLVGAGYDVPEARGYDDALKQALFEFVGTENLEERWSEDARIERQVLEFLRARA